LAPGIAVRRAVGHARLKVGAAYSTRGYKLAHGAIRFPELANGKIDVGATGRWLDATQVPFYGLGNDSVEDHRVSYRLRSFDVGADAAFKPVPWYRIGGGIASQRPEDREGLGARPSIETRHSPVSAPGLRSQPRYIQSTVFTAIDWRESPGYTRSGGLYAVALDQFRDSDDAFTFRRVTGDIRQYLPVLNEHWVFAFRALVQTTDTDSGQVIPYYLLPSLGGAQTLRGFGDFRFQDRHLLLLSGEYRWKAGQFVDMALFVDAGKVTADRSDLNVKDLEPAYGVGVRFHAPSATVLRVDVAKTREGLGLVFTAGNIF
jgi:hypothetical protein